MQYWFVSMYCSIWCVVNAYVCQVTMVDHSFDNQQHRFFHIGLTICKILGLRPPARAQQAPIFGHSFVRTMLKLVLRSLFMSVAANSAMTTRNNGLTIISMTVYDQYWRLVANANGSPLWLHSLPEQTSDPSNLFTKKLTVHSAAATETTNDCSIAFTNSNHIRPCDHIWYIATFIQHRQLHSTLFLALATV